MPDKFSPEIRSKIMAAIKSHNTQPELLVFRELKKRKVYFKPHYKKALGSPDIALPRKKVAVFIDGDFWHGYKFVYWKSRLTSEYWLNKLKRNMKRDLQYRSELRKRGWKVLRIWEHEIIADKDRTVEKIVKFLAQQEKP